MKFSSSTPDIVIGILVVICLAYIIMEGFFW